MATPSGSPTTFEPGAPEIGRPPLPPGREIELPGRGRTFVREVAGPADAPVVFLLHGWTVTAALNWFPVYKPLAEFARVVSLDHRGHGDDGCQQHVRGDVVAAGLRLVHERW